MGAIKWRESSNLNGSHTLCLNSHGARSITNPLPPWGAKQYPFISSSA